MSAELSFSLFLDHPNADLAAATLSPFFKTLRNAKSSDEFDLVSVWAYGLNAALARRTDAPFSTLKALKQWLFEERLSEVWSYSLLPFSKMRDSQKPSTAQWVRDRNETWWGTWLSKTKEYDSLNVTRFFLSDVARLNPEKVSNPFFTPLLSHSSFAYALTLDRQDSGRPVFDTHTLVNFWQDLSQRGQQPETSLVRCLTLVPDVVMRTPVEVLLTLSNNDPKLEYALFRGVASVSRVSEGFPSVQHYAMEDAIRNPLVRAYLANQCLPEHRQEGPFQDWLDRLALKARHLRSSENRKYAYAL